MCQSLLRRSRHTSTSSPISFICLFHPLIFTSVSFTITPLLRGALTSVVHSPHPKAMVRVRGERETGRQRNWVILKRWVAGEGFDVSALRTRSQWPANQPQNCAVHTPRLQKACCFPTHPQGLLFHKVDSKKWIKCLPFNSHTAVAHLLKSLWNI